MAKRSCREAAAVVGISEPFVSWGLRKAGREARVLDTTIPLGYPAPVWSPDLSNETQRYWERHGVGPSDRCITFLGTLSRSFDFSAIIEVARKISNEHPNLKFVLCGNGPQLSQLREASRSLPNVVVPGWIGQSSLRAILDRSILGLAPYVPTFDFQMSIPNKIAEYLSAGIPIASTLEDSEVSKLLAHHDCGFTYSRFDSDALYRFLIEVVNAQPDQLDHWRGNALALYRKEFQADIAYDKYAANIEEVVAQYWRKNP